VILGDENADLADGDATFNPIDVLLTNPRIDTSVTPISAGALEQVPRGLSDPGTKTAGFNPRADYALPSMAAWSYLQGWVFWPLTTDLEAGLLSASDHRMVVIDLEGRRALMPRLSLTTRQLGLDRAIAAEEAEVLDRGSCRHSGQADRGLRLRPACVLAKQTVTCLSSTLVKVTRRFPAERKEPCSCRIMRPQ
jgi:hypothetical protein